MEKQLFLFFPIKFSVKNVFQLGTPVLFQLPSFELVIFLGGGFRILCSLFNTILIVISYRLCFKYVSPVFPRFIEEFWEVGSQMTQQIVKLIKFFLKCWYAQWSEMRDFFYYCKIIITHALVTLRQFHKNITFNGCLIFIFSPIFTLRDFRY